MFTHKRIADHGISPPFHIRVSWLISSAKFLNRLHIAYVPEPKRHTTLITLSATFTTDVKSHFFHCVFSVTVEQQGRKLRKITFLC